MKRNRVTRLKTITKIYRTSVFYLYYSISVYLYLFVYINFLKCQSFSESITGTLSHRTSFCIIIANSLYSLLEIDFSQKGGFDIIYHAGQISQFKVCFRLTFCVSTHYYLLYQRQLNISRCMETSSLVVQVIIVMNVNVFRSIGLR